MKLCTLPRYTTEDRKLNFYLIFLMENEYYFQEIFRTNKISIPAPHNSIFLIKTNNIKIIFLLIG